MICGEAVCQYHHIDPPFEQARTHHVPAIGLLCGSCHHKFHGRFLTTEQIQTARARPHCRKAGYSRSYFGEPERTKEFTIVVGSCSFVHPRTVLRINGVELLTIRAPDEEDGPPLLSARFFDGKGSPTLEIEDNIYSARAANWDVETRRAAWIIRSAPRRIALKLKHYGPNRIAISRLDMRYLGVHVQADEHGIWIGDEQGLGFDGVVVKPSCAIDITSN
jgi:hypothetical protein